MLPPELRLGLNTVIVLPLLIKVMVPALTVGNPPVTQGLLKPEQGQHGTLRYSHAAGARGLQTQILLHWALHPSPGQLGVFSQQIIHSISLYLGVTFCCINEESHSFQQQLL